MILFETKSNKICKLISQTETLIEIAGNYKYNQFFACVINLIFVQNVDIRYITTTFYNLFVHILVYL